MGQEVRGVPEATSLDAGGIGHYLARQRRLRGISLEELSGMTKIPQRSLVRLESGAFDAAPDGFVRGFVRAVAVSLGLDPDDAVMRLMQEPAEAAAAPPLGPRIALWIPWLLAVALAGLLVTGLWLLVAAWRASAPPAAPPAAPSDAVLRRDPVRSLAGDTAEAEASAADAEPVTP